jgi:hypothetical protein
MKARPFAEQWPRHQRPGDGKHPLLTAGERAVSPAQNVSSTLPAEVSERIRRSRVLGVRPPVLHDSFVRNAY